MLSLEDSTIRVSQDHSQRFQKKEGSTTMKKEERQIPEVIAPDGEPIVAYVGIDWADQEHEVRMLVVETNKEESFKLKQKAEALTQWVQKLRTRFPTGKVALAVEQRRGALIYALMSYDFLILYPINPKTLARYREAFHTSQVKDDPLDAELLLELVCMHRERLRAWVPDDKNTRLLQMLVEDRRTWVDEVTRSTNRLKSTLKQYFPQAIEWAGELYSEQALDFLTTWPTLESIQKAGAEVVTKFYREHGARKQEKMKRRLEAIAEARNLTTDEAIIIASKIKTRAIVQHLRALMKTISELDEQIAQLFQQHPDYEIFSSFPCAKKVLAPRLSAAFGSDRSRYEDALDMQSLSGIAPVTKSSGKSKTVHRRLACPTFLRQTFHEYAGQSIKKPGWARVYYLTLRDRGMKHHAAVRSVAYKWIRIMYRCWQNHEPYDEAKYIASLRRRGSPFAPASPSQKAVEV
jgi:transposase